MYIGGNRFSQAFFLDFYNIFSMKITIQNITKLQEFIGSCVVKHCCKGQVICLSGDLGAGKTAFAKILINNIFKKVEDVISPTFNILQVYQNKDFPIYHYDLYRIKHELELEELGFNEAFSQGLTIIEWPDVAIQILPENYLHFHIEFGKDEEERIILINKDLLND